MINTYLIAISDSDCHPWIEEFHANDRESAEDKIITYILDTYEFDGKVPYDFRDFIKFCNQQGVYISEIYDLDEFN